jgi:hypothetical protein
MPFLCTLSVAVISALSAVADRGLPISERETNEEQELCKRTNNALATGK